MLQALNKVIGILGYNLTISRAKNRSNGARTGVNLNVGAGSYVINGFDSLDIYTPHYYKSKDRFLENRTEYDIRRDELPYKESTVDNIYISHVLEHVEDEFVEKFIEDAYRVLKATGVLRICVPDSEFLYEVSRFNNDYWSWRKKTISNNGHYATEWPLVDQLDYLIRELATPKMRFNKNRIEKQVLLPSDIRQLDYEEICKVLKQSLCFRENFPGDHINNWDYKRLKALGMTAGFSHILRSKPGGSVSKAMQGSDFDRVHAQMTLYMEFVK